MVKISPSSTGGAGQGARIPGTSWPKKKHKTSNFVTNSVKTLKLVHIKKKKKLLKEGSISKKVILIFL